MKRKNSISTKIALLFITILTVSNVLDFPLISGKPISHLEDYEWWIEVEIYSQNTDQGLNDEILVDLYDNIIQKERENILTWHFFREPTLRFRLEVKNHDNRIRIADDLDVFLQSIETIEDHYFAIHGENINTFDEGYAGERETYQRMWPYQKKIWEWGAEMTVAAIKEKQVTGKNDPSREYQLTRTYHLLALQLSSGFDIWYCFRLDNKGGNLVIRLLMASFLLGVLFTRLFNSLRTRG